MEPEDKGRFLGGHLIFSVLTFLLFSVLMLNYFILVKWNYETFILNYARHLGVITTLHKDYYCVGLRFFLFFPKGIMIVYETKIEF